MTDGSKGARHAASAIDAITLEVLRNALEATAQEMGGVLKLTAFSPNIKERMDASCAIFDPEAPIEIVGFGATAIGKVDTPELPALASGGAMPPPAAQIGTRQVFFEGEAVGERGGWSAARILLRDKLLAGNAIEGPAVIEEVSATTVLYPGDRARVLGNGALLVECGR